jgi:hypothetical protein
MGNRFKIIARLVTTQNYYIQIDVGSVTKKFTDESAPTNSAHSPPPGIDSDKEKNSAESGVTDRSQSYVLAINIPPLVASAPSPVLYLCISLALLFC